jgi:hypothetical protein
MLSSQWNLKEIFTTFLLISYGLNSVGRQIPAISTKQTIPSPLNHLTYKKP